MLSTTDHKTKSVVCAPFLRWAGGKTWLTREIDSIIGKTTYNDYHELFLGGAAMFFHLQPNNTSYLNDVNAELIDSYRCVQERVEEVIDELSQYTNSEEFYYNLRSSTPKNPIKKAARFIFLNQTSFNGIYRVNLQGHYNVPYGYRTKEFLEADKLRTASAHLKNAVLSSGTFLDCLNQIKPHDLVFLDPPYTVTHNHNGFVKYNRKLFNEKDQRDLSLFIDAVKEKGAYYLMTNAAHDWVRNLFKKSGDKVIPLGRASLIGGKNAKRGIFEEYVFTNLRNHQPSNAIYS